MDKNTLGNYGWVVITVIIISIMIALASPFAVALKGNVVGVTNDFTGRLDAALEGIGGSDGEDSGSEGETQKFTFLQTVTDGNYIYTYYGYETEEEKHNSYKLYVEKFTGMSFEEYLIACNLTEQEAYSLLDDDFEFNISTVGHGPQWQVELIDKNTSGNKTFPSHFQNIPVTMITEDLFNEDVYGLTNVVFPETTKVISRQSFKNVTTVTLLTTTPPVSTGKINSQYVFEFDSATAIYVPAESVEAYKNAEGWNAYADIIQAIPTT